jgi:16S rRNA (adenine1518-N6/adenine1519-N6)-dimethyltransferase
MVTSGCRRVAWSELADRGKLRGGIDSGCTTLNFMGAELLLSQTKKELRRLDLRAKKGLGQHFLVDERVLSSLISAAELATNDTVVEVGPGLGILTKELARKAGRVIAIEVDTKMASVLKEIFVPWPNVTIINADVLGNAPEAFLVKGPYKVVANLPYYIASAVLRHFLEASIKPHLIVVTLQKEVAQAIVAPPGKMSLLSVSVQFYGRPAIVDYVPARSFYPLPKVDSAIVRIDLYDHPAVAVDDEAKFFRVVRSGFSAPRKQLHNSLAQGLEISAGDAVALLEEVGISQKRRAETLSLEEWARVYRVFTEKQC